VEGVLIQKSPRFNVRVPVEVTGATVSRRENVTLDDATATFSIQMQEAPRTIAADPDFDVFRLLYPEEIPATVNAVKGSNAPSPPCSPKIAPSPGRRFSGGF
jgi:aminopeptidase N